MKKTLNILLAFFLFLFVICLSVVITLNFTALYDMTVDTKSLSSTYNISEEIISNNYNTLVRYNSIFSNFKLEFDSLSMSEQGAIHFYEVRNIFVGIQILLGVSFFACLFGIIKKLKSKDYKFLLYSAIMTISVPLVLGAFVMSNWSWSFTTFHKIFFRNDYWIFNPATDPIILFLPDNFFFACAILIISLIFIFIAIMLLLYFKSKKEKLT